MTDSKSGWYLKAPCVTLYAFHLRDEISKDPAQINANHLWEQCVALGAADKLNVPVLRSLRTQLLCYEKDSPGGYNPALEKPDHLPNLPLLKKSPRTGEDPFLRFPVVTQPNTPNLKGEIYPLRIRDTYAVDLSLRYLETVEIDQLRHFNPNNCLLPTNIKASLGQTLVIFANPTCGIDDYEALANACIDAFLQDTNLPQPELIATGKLFGSPIFEYDTSSINPLEQCHVLVWLQGHRVWPKRHPDTIALSQKVYHYFLQLLCCRSKILYAYHQARLCNREARELCSQIEKRVTEFSQMKAESENPEERSQRVEQLKKWLIEIQQTGFKYAHRLRDMEDHKTAIAINSENYCYWFSQIRNYSLPEDNLDFLDNFLNRICKHFQEQIQVDLRYLTPAQALFQQMIDTIRGIVEIEAEKQAQEREQKQKERDRTLQDTIQCLGVGIGAASIVASTTGYLTQKESVSMPFNSYSIHPFTLSLIFSIVAGAVFYAGAWWISGLINPRRDRTAKLQGSANNKLLNSASTPIAGQVTGVPHKAEFPTQLPRK
jgi:hypothetical protein